MNLPTLIDVALGLALVFFILASIGSVLAEFWAAHQKLRHQQLRRTVTGLLEHETAKKFWSHALIQPLFGQHKDSRAAAPAAAPAAAAPAPAPDPAAAAAKPSAPQAAPAKKSSPGWFVRHWQGFKRDLIRYLPREADAPAYLDAKVFATTVLDLAGGQGAAGPVPQSLAAWEAAIRTYIPAKPGANNDLQDRLLALLRQLPPDTVDVAAALKASIAHWYEEAMQRSSGVYRRQTQKALLIIGAILAAALNVDALRMAQILYLNPQLRSDVAAQAVALAEETKAAAATTTGNTTTANTTATGNATVTGNTAATLTGNTTTTATGNATTTKPAAKTPREQLRDSAAELRDLAKVGFPLGWQPVWRENFLHAKPAPAQPERLPSPDSNIVAQFIIALGQVLLDAWDTVTAPGWLALFLKFLGLAASALAVCLGAPFWFDVIGRLVKLRSSAGSDAEKAKPANASSGATGGSGNNPPPTAGGVANGGGVGGGGGSTPATTALKPVQSAKDALALDGTPPTFSVARAYWLAEFADHAYETNATLLDGWLKQQGFQLVQPTIANAQTDTQGFLATAGNVAVLAFRGTEKQLQDWFTDAQAEQIADPAKILPGALHQGFITAYNSVAEDVAKAIAALPAGTKLHVTGHSLGAALATLAALRLDATPASTGTVATVHTYGSPRVGDPVFAAAFERAFRGRAWRFVNNEDLVTRVPPPKLELTDKKLDMNYEHVGEMKFIDAQGKLLGDVSFMYRLLNFTTNALGDLKDAIALTLKDHSMALYCALLRRNA